MRFQKLDLNLLVTLDRLLTERSISRAAEKLYLSQSATSSALARLREYFQDELLVRVGRTMVPTPRALELSQSVREVLLQIEGRVIKRPEFDPARESREIRMIASDYSLIAGLAAALIDIRAEAPKLRFVFSPQQLNPREDLERGEADFLIIPEMYLSPLHPSQKLFSDDYCVVSWDQNTCDYSTMNVGEFMHQNHVAVQFPNSKPTYESWVIERYGSDRNVEVTVGSFAAVPYLLIGTDRISLMHRRLAVELGKTLPLKICEPPIDIPRIDEFIQWHIYNDGDECLAWVRNKLAAFFQDETASETD
ncbi:MAG: LysR family transcriptional regulator [Rhodobacteraceae bacterium]|nr:LysR family transcriptional regulator [Paracoccaceae bacterium]